MQRIVISGRVAKDAEVRFTNDGKQVADFNFAVPDGGKDKVIWFRCSLWGERASKLADYLKKGTSLTLDGRLSHDNGNPRIWGDPARASFEMYVDNLEFGGGGKKQEEELPF